MADIHVLIGNGETWTVVFHVPIPTGVTNTAGVDLRDALARSGIGQQTNADGTPGRRTIMVSGNQPGEIAVPEENNLDDGSLFEVVSQVRLESGGTTAAAVTASLRIFYASLTADVVPGLTTRLQYFGLVESAT